MDPEDIKDPLNINNFWCMSYIEKKIPDLFQEQQDSMAKGERPNPATRKLWQDAMKRKGEIGAKCGSGEMTPEQYVELLKQQVDKDTKLLAHFMQSKEAAKAKICQERLAIVKAELAEMQ